MNPLLFPGLAVLIALAPAEPFTGSAAYSALRRSGRQVLLERSQDIDGDGRADVLVVCGGEAGIELSAFRALPEGGFALLTKSRTFGGSLLRAFEPVALGQRAGFRLEVVEDSPDEADCEVALFVMNPAGLVEVFAERYRELHSEEEAGREAIEQVDLLGLALGLGVAPAGPGDFPRLFLRDSPRALRLRSGRAREALVALRERAYAAHAGGRYHLVGDSVRKALSPLTLVSPVPEVEDGDLATGWLAPARTPLRLELREPGPLRAVRLIPGCGESAEEWASHPAVSKLTLQVDGAPPIALDGSDPRLLGVADLALPGRGFGSGLLVLFASPLTARVVTVSLEAEGTPCLAEVELLSALVDRP